MFLKTAHLPDQHVWGTNTSLFILQCFYRSIFPSPFFCLTDCLSPKILRCIPPVPSPRPRLPTRLSPLPTTISPPLPGPPPPPDVLGDGVGPPGCPPPRPTLLRRAPPPPREHPPRSIRIPPFHRIAIKRINGDEIPTAKKKRTNKQLGKHCPSTFQAPTKNIPVVGKMASTKWTQLQVKVPK